MIGEFASVCTSSRTKSFRRLRSLCAQVIDNLRSLRPERSQVNQTASWLGRYKLCNTPPLRRPSRSTPPAAATGSLTMSFALGAFAPRNLSAGFGLYQDQSRDRWEASARLQNILTTYVKVWFEFYKNKYAINRFDPAEAFRKSEQRGTTTVPRRHRNVTATGVRTALSFVQQAHRCRYVVCRTLGDTLQFVPAANLGLDLGNAASQRNNGWR